MPILTLTLQTLTPLITKGAANDARNDPAELRAASFRGMFRYWLRALLGARVQGNLEQLRRYETDIFGSVRQGSRVSLIVTSERGVRSESEQEVLPIYTSKGWHNTFHAIPPNTSFYLTVRSHPLGDMPIGLLLTMLVAFTLGGIGRRARRGGGSLRVLHADYKPEDSEVTFDSRWFTETPPDQDALVEYVRKRLDYALKYIVTNGKHGKKFPALPTYPVLMPEYAHVLVGPARSSAREALDTMWNIRKKHPYHDNRTFGSINPRIPSPVHMRVNVSKAGYHPVMTIFYTDLRHPKTNQPLIHDWSPMQQFIEECTSQHNFVLVKFGGGSKP